MRTAVVYDCEFLTNQSAPQRFWCGPMDPDPTVVQIGAVQLALDGSYELGETFETVVRPRDRTGAPAELDPHFTWLTGITPERVENEGVPLADALARFGTFAGDGTCWSWGKDEINMLAISCWVEGIESPMRPDRFGNAAGLLVKTDLDPEAVGRMRSNTICETLGVTTPPLRAHDALGDAMSVAYALQHLLREGQLRLEHFGADARASA